MEEVTKKDVLKHYLSSIFVYGIAFLFVIICPVFNMEIRNPYFNYITVLGGYYLLYVIFAYPLLLKFKPESILNSKNIAVCNYIKRQFRKTDNLKEYLNSMAPNEEEKQGLIILFVKTFFGVYCLNLLCGEYLPSINYNIDFLTTLFYQDMFNSGGIGQFIEDCADVILMLIFTITTCVYAFSYLTETSFLKNKIKYVDTTPLGILSCIVCFSPFVLITNQIIPTATEMVPVDSHIVRVVLFIFVILANLGILLAVLRLGTKVGNLTNRGIVTGFPYNIVRHPEYSMQIIYIVLTAISICIGELNLLGKILYFVGAMFWIFIYYLRAITEERNLIADEKYLEYTNKVKYRFIPWLI